MDKRLQDLFEEYWEYRMEVSPGYATFTGRDEYNDRLEDMSREAHKEEVKWTRDFLSKLREVSVSELSEEDLLSHEILVDQLEHGLEFENHPTYLLPLNQMMGVHLGFLQLARVHPFRNLEDFEDFNSRLRAHGKQLEHCLIYLKEGLERSYTLPEITVKLVCGQLENMIKLEVQDCQHLQTALQSAKGLDSDCQDYTVKLEESYTQTVLPQLKKIHEFLSGEYREGCRREVGLCHLNNGLDLYRLYVKNHTGLSEEPKEIHQRGLDEVARIHSQMKDLQSKLGIEGSLQDFFEAMRSRSDLHYSNREEIVTHHQDLLKEMAKKLPEYFHTLPKNPYEVHPLPAYQEKEAPDAFYMPGEPSSNRPGVYYVNTYEPQTRARFNAEVLAYHEAIPGHHLQISIAQELKDIPEFRKRSSETAYVEGWALYTEKLSHEMGFYEDLHSQFGKLSFELWRAARLVVDTGLHALSWTREKAIDYMNENTGLSKANIEVEVDRYIAYPGQALSYKIGEIYLLNLRRELEEKLQDEFSIQDFHEEVLRHGALPLPRLGEIVRKQLLTA